MSTALIRTGSIVTTTRRSPDWSIVRFSERFFVFGREVLSETRTLSPSARNHTADNRFSDGRAIVSVTVFGVAWGAAISRVEVSIDGGSRAPAQLCGQTSQGASANGLVWQFWTFDWGTPSPGTHTVTSRAFDVNGNVQPPPDDPYLSSRRTYWENNGQITRTVVTT